jgi:hypothetical protein
MAYLVPYTLALKPDEQALYRSYLLQDITDIPDGTYQLQEWYCPNPDCPCQEVLFEVLSLDSKRFVASFRVSLDPTLSPSPKLSPSEDTAPYAIALQQQIAEDLKSDPAFIFRLRSHYNLVKAVAADPKHPSHWELTRLAKSGILKSPSDKPKRKRHK